MSAYSATNGYGAGASSSRRPLSDPLVPSIYHEKQEPGSMLCGNHALNNLMQSGLWTAEDLAVIARQLDSLEDATFDEELRAKRRGRSANYDDSGFFSIQVLDSALNNLSLQLVRWRSTALKPAHPFPESQSAFILNRHQHWYALRRFNASPDRWYNLDSLADGGPRWIGATYLGMTLEEAERNGYSVFCVRPVDGDGGEGVGGRPPPGESFLHLCEADEAAFQMDVGQSGPPPLASSASSSENGSSNGKRRADDGEEEGMDGDGGSKRQRMEEEGEGEGGVDEEEEQLRKAIAASLLDDRPSGGQGTKDAPVDLTSSSPARPRPPVDADEGDEDYGLVEDEDGDGGFLPVSPQPRPHAARSQPANSTARPAVDEDEELQAAIRASLADSGTSGSGAGPGESDQKQREGEGEGEGGWDEPSAEELRRRRLARFGG